MPISRLLAVLAVILVSSTPPAQAGNHFGFPIAVFSYDLHPGEPLEEHAAGNLGVIRPTYARSYLYTAYRWIEGAPMNTEEQQALAEYWRVKLELAKPQEKNDDGGWFELRESLGIPFPDKSGPPNPVGGILAERNFVYYTPCLGNAFAVAADRLRDHIARFGRTSQEVRSWVAAQDLVFRACDQTLGAGTIPEEARADLNPDIRRDRAYQIAATLFNGGRFQEAETRFRAIVPDPSYPGGLWAPYMIGRSILWQARFEQDDAEYARLLRKARFQLQNVLQDDRFAATHDAARFLLLRILTAIDREPGARLLGIRLMSPLRSASRPQDLIQYFELLDAAIGSAYAKPTIRTARSLGRRDDVTDWILTFQSGPSGAEHSIERWRQTGSISWLIAALSGVPAGHAALPALLDAAAKIERSPGWPSVQYYRAERLIEAGRIAEARAALDALLPALASRPSSANRARALRTQASTTFAEALRYGFVEPAAFGDMTSFGERTQPWDWRARGEDLYGKQTMRPLATPAFARILNSSIPLDRFAALPAGNVDIPQPLRHEMLLAAWIRAVLLQRWDVATPLAAACAREIPETAPYLSQISEATGRTRDLLVKLALLRFPGISVEIRAGIGRNTPLQDLQREGLNWWWWQDDYRLGLSGHPDSVALDWITPAERQQADREWARIVALGEGHDWLYAGVLMECDVAKPATPCAEALYRTGASYAAVGYWHDPASTDVDLGYLDHRALPILERAFPQSTWTRHYQADIEWLRQGEYYGQNSVPYPR